MVATARLDALERRFLAPKRVGLFGHRAVGKTTLLAMLYREASEGRTPSARLAAIEPETSEYLAETIARIESGEQPPGTLAETELQLRLYRDLARFDLILKDYQGEDITLGSEEPILEFLDDCDALLLCLDPEVTDNPVDQRRRQQEVENLLESYLDRSDEGRIDYPVAILVTKYDRVLARHGEIPVETFVAEHFGMTGHLLRKHAPRSAIFGVSSFGIGGGLDGRPPQMLRPLGFDPLLGWMADRLEEQDGERLKWLWDLASDDVGRLTRCVRAFDRRYPRSNQALDFDVQLRTIRKRRFWKRTLVGLGLAASITLSLAGYDYWSYRQTLHFEQSGQPPSQIAQRWASFQEGHPSLPWLWPNLAREAERREDSWTVQAAEQLAQEQNDPDQIDSELLRIKQGRPELADQVRQLEQTQAQRQHDQRWLEIRTAVELLSDEPQALLNRLETFLVSYPESPRRPEAVELAKELNQRKLERVTVVEQRELDAIRRAEDDPLITLDDQIARIDQFLEDHPETALRLEALNLRSTYLTRRDERDIRRARDLSRDAPQRYAERIAAYQRYLDAHASGGQFVREALEAQEQIRKQWDDASYRQAYDHAQAHPDDLDVVVNLVRNYLEAHPEGRHADKAQGYLEWFEAIDQVQSYRVTLLRGRVAKDQAKFLSGGGPDLSVTVKVAGTTYGPSPIIKNNFKPIWNSTFDRPIAWKRGDPVVIEVVDHDWGESTLLRLKSEPNDPLALWMLSGPIRPTSHRAVELLEFRSDFSPYTLPAPESSS